MFEPKTVLVKVVLPAEVEDVKLNEVAGRIPLKTEFVSAIIRIVKAAPKATIMMATIIPTMPISPAILVTLPRAELRG